jgi:hypothetical protein
MIWIFVYLIYLFIWKYSPECWTGDTWRGGSIWAMIDKGELEPMTETLKGLPVEFLGNNAS